MAGGLSAVVGLPPAYSKHPRNIPQTRQPILKVFNSNEHVEFYQNFVGLAVDD